MAFNFSRFIHWLPRLGVMASLGLAMLLSSCSSSSPKVKGVPSSLPSISLYGKARTPPHAMARADYPFDSNGNYVTSWAAEGRSSAGPSDYRSSRSHHDDDDAPPRRKSSSSTSSSSGSKKKTASSAPAKKRVVDDDPPAKKKVASSSSSSTAAKKSSSGGGGSKHVVKSSDSLWSLAKKYGTTVEKIKAANGLKGTNIRDGAALTIPK